MTQILLLADNQRDPQSRAAEHDRVLDHVAGLVETMKPDAVAHSGDWTERRPTHEDREYLFGWIRRVARVCPIVGVEGNHEEPGFCDEFAHLDVERPVDVATTPRVVQAGGVAFGLCPWPRRERLRQWLGRPAATGDVDELANELLLDVLRGLGAELARDAAPDMPRVLVIHAEPAEYKLGADQPMHVAQGMRVAIEDMVQLTGCDLVACGHIHRPDTFIVPRGDGVDVPVLLIGSPRRTAYAAGELEEKGIVLVTFNGRTPTWQRIPTPSTPMQLVEATWRDGEIGPNLYFDADPPVIAQGSEVRLRYTVPSDQREAARAKAAKFVESWRVHSGAAEVKLDEVVLPVSVARAPEVAAAPTVAGKLSALWDARAEGLSCDRRERLLRKVADVEEEVAR